MKKLAALTMALMIALLGLCASSSAAPQTMGTLLDRANALAEKMCELALNEAYWRTMTTNEEMIAHGQQWGSGHDAKPAFVVQLNGEAAQIESIVARMNAAFGANVIASLSIVGTGGQEIFACDDVGDGAYVMIYENAVPILAVWHSENGAVSMRTTFLPFEELAACAAEEEATAWLEQAFPSVSVGLVADIPVVVSKPVDVSAMEKVLAVAAGMDNMAGNEAFLNQIGMSANVVSLLKEWSVGDADKPVLTVMTELNAESESIRALIALLSDDTGMDDQRLMGNLVSAVPTMLLGQYCGLEQLAASASARRRIFFGDSNAPLAGLYLLIYEDKVPIIVSAHASEGAVSMIAFYLPIEELADCRSAADVNGFFEGFGLPLTWELADSSR